MYDFQSATAHDLQPSTALQLGGLHSNAYISDLFAQNYAKTGMKAYVELIQRKERELGTDVLTHQKVSTVTVALSALTDCLPSGVVQTMLITLSRRLRVVYRQRQRWEMV